MLAKAGESSNPESLATALSTHTAILLLQMAAQYKYGRIGRGTPDFLSGIAKKFDHVFAVIAFYGVALDGPSPMSLESPAIARNSMVLPLPESSNDEHTFASRTPNKAPQKKRRLQEPNAEVSRQLGQVARVLVDEA